MGGMASKLLAGGKEEKKTEMKTTTGGGMASRLLGGAVVDASQPANAREQVYISQRTAGQKPETGETGYGAGASDALRAAAEEKLRRETSTSGGSLGTPTFSRALDTQFAQDQAPVMRQKTELNRAKQKLDEANAAYEAARKSVSDAAQFGYGSQERRERLHAELSAAKEQRDTLRREYEAMGGEPEGFLRRALYTIKGGAKQSLGSNADAMGTLYQAGQGGRNRENTEVQEQAKKTYEEELRKLNALKADNRYSQTDIEVQETITAEAKRKYDSLSGVDLNDVQVQAGEAARDLAAGISQSGAQDIDTAKRGIGTLGQMAVDAGASMTQMAGDMAGNAVLGANPGAMLPFGMRAFGGGTMEARAEGADLEHQMLYGTAMAGKEIFTEKMFNIALPFSQAYGSGSGLEDAVENAIKKAVDRFASTDAGKKVLGGALSYVTGAVSEGLEELIGDWIEWQMPRIYGGEVESASEVLANSLYDFAVGTLSGMVGVDQLNYDADTHANIQANETAGQDVSGGKAVDTGKSQHQSKGILTEEVRAAFGKEGQQIIDTVVENSMRRGMSMAEAYGAFSKAYHQGVTESTMTAVDGLSEDGLNMAYKAGRNDAAASLAREKRAAKFASVAGNDAGLVLDDYVQDLLDRSEMEQTEYDTLNQTAKKLGLRVRFVDELEHGANAKITGSEVRIQKDNPNPVRFLLGHEITHRMQDLAPKEYRKFRNLVMQGESERTLVYQYAYQEGGEALDYEGAMDEAAADYAGKLLEGGQMLEEFISRNQNDRTLLEWLRDFFRGLVDKLTGKERAKAQTAEQALTKALDAAAKQAEKNAKGNKNTAQTSGEGRYSLNPEFSREFDEWMDSGTAEERALHSRGYFKVGTTSDALKSIGVRAGNIYWRKQKISYIMDDHAEIDGETVKTVPNIIEHPIVVMKSQTREDSIVLFGDVKAANGQNVMAALELTPRSAGGMEAEFSLITSAYGRTEQNIKHLVEDSEILYLDPDKKRTDTWLTSIRVQFPSDQPVYGSMGSIRYENGSVNISGKKVFGNENNKTRFSLMDSAGRKLTAEQAEFFKDSKVTDEQGRLKEVYHGTARSDRVGTVFRPDRATSGPMAFFTDNMEIADSYARNKKDTSLDYDEEYSDYYQQFRVERGGKRIAVSKLWNSLSMQERAEIKERAKHITLDDDAENIIYDETVQHGNGAFDDYTLHQHRGNAIDALIDTWLESGELWNREADFLDVLKLVGIDDAAYMDPDARYEKVYGVYLNITNPFDAATVDSEFVAELEAWLEENPPKEDDSGVQTDMWDKRNITPEKFIQRLMDDIEAGTSHAWTSIPDFVTDFLKSKGHDGIKDIGGKNGGDIHTVWIPFSSEQVKNTDNQNPTTDPDIRFSMNGAREFADQVLALQQERGNKTDAEVRSEIIRMAEAFQEQLTQDNGLGLTDRKAVRRAGRALIKQFGADMKPGEITDELQALYDYMAGGENGTGDISYSQAREMATDVARKLVESATVVDDTLYREFSDLRSYLRDTKIVVPEEAVREIGDFNDYRKSTMGKLLLGTKGHANLDMVYSELCEMYPAWFDGEALAASDQLDQIVSAAEAIYNRPEYNPFDGGDMEQVVQSAAREIMESFYDLPQAKNRQSQRMSERERAALRREVSEQLNRQREYNDREMEKLRQRHEKTIEQLETTNLRKRIARHANRMGQMLLKPTDKKHVPEGLRGAAATLVEAINLESAYVWNYDEETGKATLVLEKNAPEGVKTKRTEAFLRLREQYAVILQGIKDGEGDFMGVVDPQLAEYIDEAVRLRDKKLGEMDRGELDTIWKALRAVEHSITTADKVLSEAKFERVGEWSNALAADTATRKNKSAMLKAHPSLDLETPYTFFSHFGESGTAIYKMLRKAQDKQQMLVEEIAEAVSGIVTPEQVQDLQNELHEFTTERGQKLTLNTSQVMEIYELTKRKQAHDHLMEGGIVQPEVSKDIRRGTEPIKLSMEDLQQITGALTEEQAALADQMQQLCVTVLARWGNEASMQAYGYKKFTDPHYWPIRSAGEGLYQTVEKGGDQPRQIKNIGMGKATTPHASTPMDISGLFSTFARHAADMSDYAAWLCPMEDCTRLFNYKFRDEDGANTGKSVKSILDQTAGEQAQAYWRNLMEDIQNGISAKSDSMSWGTMGKLVGSFKGAAVGGNIRVVIQQPTAFFRASAVLNPADMAAGITGGVAKVTGEDGKTLSGWEKAMKYAPIAVRKDRGGFDISSPRMMTEILYDERTKLRKFNDALSAAAGKADAVTWGKLWNACEHAVQREQKALEVGSDAFFQAVSEKFSNVIDQTQVIDGVLQRSNIMRSSNGVVQQATAFMGEPIMSLNLMMRAWDAWRYEQNQAKRSKALKTMSRAATALVVTNLVNAVAQSLVDAMRADDPDKEYWERFLEAFTGLDGEEESVWDAFWSVAFDGNAGENNNALTMIPFVKDVVSLAEGYDVARTEMEVISDLVTAAQGVIKNIGGDGKRTRKYAINELVRSAAKMFGIPVKNLERDAWGILRTFAVASDNIPLQYEMEKAVYNLEYAGNKGRFLDVMFRALEQEDYESYDHIRNDLMQAGVVDGKAIDSGMQSRLESRRSADPAYTLPERATELIGWRPTVRSGDETRTEQFSEGNLNADQYKAFSEERAELYRGYSSRLDSNRHFAELDDETRQKVYDAAAKLAKAQALENNAAGQYEMDTAWMQWAVGGSASGVDETEAILFKVAYDMASGKDESGKTVSGLKRERTLETAEQWMPWLTDQEREYLMSQFWK